MCKCDEDTTSEIISLQFHNKDEMGDFHCTLLLHYLHPHQNWNPTKNKQIIFLQTVQSETKYFAFCVFHVILYLNQDICHVIYSNM